MNAIHVTSEIKPLKKVLLHRPGNELLNLTPDTLHDLLFDDIPYLKDAQDEHDEFARILKSNGVEVVYLEDLMTDVLNISQEIKEKFLRQFIEEAVYGLCEINREDVQKARIIANPGCYPTCSILSVYPLAKAGLIDMDTLIIDAKSGTSGAGRGAKIQNLYCEVNENIKAYGVASHRHTPEIEEQLGYASGKQVVLNFTPHLIAINRGILITAYAKLKAGVSEDQVKAAYEIYNDEYFVRVLKVGVVPEVRNVKCSNFVDVSYVIDPRTQRVIMMGAMDNLVKGAAGQAIQNMNIMFGLDEKTGLMLAPAVL